MNYHDKTQLTLIIIALPIKRRRGPPLSEPRILESTHYRTGPKALLSYNVSKGPELSNPMDLNSAPTGNTCFVLTEIYEGNASVADHFEQTNESWGDFPAMGKWMEKCKVTFVPAAFIINSLW